MADRTVKVKLTADISDYTAQLAKAAAATRTLGGDVEKGIDRDVAPVMRRAGEKQGGLLARGINNGLVRNSPLIAAGVAAALAAGAPAILAGATALFAGVGGLAAAQTAEVREAFTDLGHDIRDGAVEDASVLIPVFENMADKIGAAFQRMRPEIRDAFEASAPLIDDFTDSLTQAAENALPGLVRAVERGGPVIEGLGKLMEDIGTGLSDFLDAMSEHSGAAGAALGAIGDALAEALPLLGELLGTGAELAAVVLPPLAAALGVVRDIADALGPVLPTIVLGFAGFKAAKAAAGFLDDFGKAGSRVNTISSGLSRSVPLIAAAFAAWSVRTQAISADLSKFRAAAEDAFAGLNAGGAEAEMAAAKLAFLEEVAANGPDNFLGLGADLEGELKIARQAAEDTQRSMSDLNLAEQAVAARTADLEAAVGRYGPASEQASAASAALASAQARLTSEQRALELATDGVTSAMIEQAEQVLANANSDLAYRQSVDATEEAQVQLAAAMAEFGANSEQARDAALALEQAVLAEAAAAGQLAADALPAATSEAQRNAAAQAAQLASLLQLRNEMGSLFPAALNATIERLQATTSAGMVAAAQFNQLKLNVLAVPNSKTIIVDSTTPEQIELLEQLGFKVETLPDGTVRVTALTSDAEAALAYVSRPRTTTISAYVQTIGGFSASIRADGGPIYAATGRKVIGPGGPRDDLVRARAGNVDYRLSDGEWIINAATSSREGDAKMAALNAGRATIVGREFSGFGSSPTVNVAAPSLNGMRITGTVQLDPASGLIQFMDARIDGAMGAVADTVHYAGGN